MVELLLANLELLCLVVLLLLLYGLLHARLILFLMARRQELMLLGILAVSPFGVGVPLLALALLVGQAMVSGWEAAILAVALEGIAFAPVALLVGREILHERQERLALDG